MIRVSISSSPVMEPSRSTVISPILYAQVGMRMLDDQEALDRIHRIEMHPKNRVLFVFQDGHTEEHFWKDHSRRDS